VIIRNRIAIFGWIFTTAFLIFCALITYILIRDGSSTIQIDPPHNTNVYPQWFMPLIMFGFWIAGITVAMHMWHIPVVRVSILQSASVLVEHIYPIRRVKHQFAMTEIQPATVIKTTDSEGDVYYKCEFRANNGFLTTLSESSNKEPCELCCRQFNEAIERHKIG
jgi:hypothetical protein